MNTDVETIPNIMNHIITYTDKLEENTYYTNFSKHIIQSNTYVANTPPLKFAYTDFVKSTLDNLDFHFDKYKLSELKQVAKHYKLPVSGNKPIVIERIRTFFNQTTATNTIQRIFRGHMVRYSYKLRGPAFHNRQLCVNETEFYTLDPISEIPDESFFSFVDSRNYVYGFDICSIISLITKSEKPINPYNREAFPYDATVALHKLYNITKILFPNIWYVYYEQNTTKTYTKPSTYTTVNRNDNINTIFQTINASTSSAPSVSLGNVPTTRNQIIAEQSEINQRLETIRREPFETRTRELFMEINLLGNYAESRWFTELNRIRLARYYQFYYDWWFVRSRLNNETRNRICMLDDPFSDVNLLYLYPTTTLEDYREACLRLMENMVYGTRDIEYRKLGALHLLSILTVVSEEARRSMPWLYESII